MNRSGPGPHDDRLPARVVKGAVPPATTELVDRTECTAVANALSMPRYTEGETSVFPSNWGRSCQARLGSFQSCQYCTRGMVLEVTPVPSSRSLGELREFARVGLVGAPDGRSSGRPSRRAEDVDDRLEPLLRRISDLLVACRPVVLLVRGIICSEAVSWIRWRDGSPVEDETHHRGPCVVDPS